MKRLLSAAFQFLVYTNLYLGLVLGFFTFHGFGGPDELRFEYALLMATSSSSLYGFHALFGLRYIQESDRSHRHLWLYNNRRFYGGMLAMLGFLALFQLFFIPQLVFLLLPAVALTALYVLPILGKRLRDYNYVKVLLVSLVVLYLCRFIPQYLNGKAHWNGAFFLEALLCFAFLFLLTLPFDLRDRKVEYGRQTKVWLPDWNRSYKLVFIGLSTCILGLILLSLNSPSTALWRLSEVAALSFTFLALAIPENKRKELFYPLFFEGPLLLMGLFSFLLAI